MQQLHLFKTRIRRSGARFLSISLEIFLVRFLSSSHFKIQICKYTFKLLYTNLIKIQILSISVFALIICFLYITYVNGTSYHDIQRTYESLILKKICHIFVWKYLRVKKKDFLRAAKDIGTIQFYKYSLLNKYLLP